MNKTTRYHLLAILDDLTGEQFDLFKYKLCDGEYEHRIPRGKVEKATRSDIVNILISKHTTDGAVTVTINILKSMDCNDLATRLKKTTFQGEPSSGGGASRGGAAPPAAGPCGTTGERHFIDVHRTALTDRVSSVSAILDRLLDQGVIDQSDYDEIRAESTKQNRMRKLFSGRIHSGGKIAKEVLYKILEEQEPLLMNELKEL